MRLRAIDTRLPWRTEPAPTRIQIDFDFTELSLLVK